MLQSDEGCGFCGDVGRGPGGWRRLSPWCLFTCCGAKNLSAFGIGRSFHNA